MRCVREDQTEVKLAWGVCCIELMALLWQHMYYMYSIHVHTCTDLDPTTDFCRFRDAAAACLPNCGRCRSANCIRCTEHLRLCPAVRQCAHVVNAAQLAQSFLLDDYSEARPLLAFSDEMGRVLQAKNSFLVYPSLCRMGRLYS